MLDLSLELKSALLGAGRGCREIKEHPIGRRFEGVARAAKPPFMTLRLSARQDKHIPSLGDREKLRQITSNPLSTSRQPWSQPAGVTWVRDLRDMAMCAWLQSPVPLT